MVAISKANSGDNFKTAVFQLVKKIPKGKVATYGEVARILGKRNWARQVGWALHANRSTDVPCHRVVDRNGRLAPNFAFDGWREQKRRLEQEGVKFASEMHVDMKKCLWNFTGPVTIFPPASARFGKKSKGDQLKSVDLRAVGIPSNRATRKFK